jgi:hypothetical protein
MTVALWAAMTKNNENTEKTESPLEQVPAADLPEVAGGGLIGTVVGNVAEKLLDHAGFMGGGMVGGTVGG